MPDIEQALQALRSDGRWESTGHFQIDMRLALEKMGRFGWPDPRFLVLKVIQGMVGLGCTEIDVQQNSARLVLRGWHFRPESVERVRFNAALTLGKTIGEGHDDAYATLAAGVAAALWQGASVCVQSLNELWFNFGDLPVEGNRGLVVTLEGNETQDARGLVVTRCAHMPIPLRWNGAGLARYYRGLLSIGPDYSWRQQPLLGELSQMLPGNPRGLGSLESGQTVPPGARHWRKHRYPVLCRLKSPGAPMRVFIPRAMQGPSRLVPVQGGVTLEPIELFPDFGCLVVAEADAVPVDLSGFRARQGEQLSLLQAQARAQTSVLAGHAMARLHQLRRAGEHGQGKGRWLDLREQILAELFGDVSLPGETERHIRALERLRSSLAI